MLTFGVLGVGYFGKHYVRLLNELPEAKLVASGNAAEADAIINSPNIQCIVISAPPSQHFPLAQAALTAGKHILVEKPMVLNLKDAKTLAALAKKMKRILMVGHQYFYNDYANELAKQLAGGIIGDVKLVISEHLYPGPIRTDTSCLWEAGTHALALMDQLFQLKKIISVKGTTISLSPEKRGDFTNATVSFADGPSLHFIVSWFAPEKIRRLTIIGAKGMAVFDEQQPDPLKFILHPYPAIPTDAASQFLKLENIVTPALTPREPLRNQLEHFIDCVANKKTPRTGSKHGVLITRWLEMIDKKIVKLS